MSGTVIESNTAARVLRDQAASYNGDRFHIQLYASCRISKDVCVASNVTIGQRDVARESDHSGAVPRGFIVGNDTL
jgi:hypothetical protein